MVAIINLHDRTFAVPVRTGSNIPGDEYDPIRDMVASEGFKDASSLCAPELTSMIAQWKSQLDSAATGEGVHTRSMRKPVLVVDLSSVHTSQEFKAAMQAMRQEVLFLPPRSHDLDPCDSHFFATVKSKTKQALAKSGDHTWAGKVAELRKQMAAVQAAPHIANYMLRLEACINAGGRRFHYPHKKAKK